MSQAVPSPSRRAFLRGGRAAARAIRPPGALDEAEFLDRCTRCAACIEACPEALLVGGDGGFAQLDPTRGECTFCGDCISACTEGALLMPLLGRWPWRAALGEGCLAQQGVVCQACRDACGEQAIRFPPGAGLGTPQIDAAACTGCAACVAACPTAALGLRHHPAQREAVPA